MKKFLARLASEAAAPVEDMAARLLKRAALLFAGILCLLISSIFLTIALFIYLEEVADPAISALCIGGLYLVFALGCILFSIWSGRKSSTDDEEAPQMDPNEARMAAMMGEPVKGKTEKPVKGKTEKPVKDKEFAANIDDVVAPILDILREQGLERERLAVETGAAVAKQLNPFSFLALAIAAGLFLGRIIDLKNLKMKSPI